MRLKDLQDVIGCRDGFEELAHFLIGKQAAVSCRLLLPWWIQKGKLKL